LRISVDEPAKKRSHQTRWAVLIAAATIIAALFAWDPGGEDAPAAGRGAAEKVAHVETATAALGTMIERGSYPGELAADAAELASNVAGRLESVSVRLGDRVRAGAQLARVDAAEWIRQREEAAAELSAAAATERRVKLELDAADRDLGRVKKLLENDVVSEQEGDLLATRVSTLSAELEAAKAERSRAQARVGLLEQKIADCRLVAPFDGVVSNRYVDPGAFLAAGAPILRVVASGPLRVRFEVPEAYAPLLAPGAAITVRASADRSEAAGKISGVGGEVDRTSRIVRTEAILENAPASWLPGMFVQVSLALHTHEQRVLVPDLALVARVDARGAEQTGVFLAVDEIARWVPVKVLGRDGRKIAIEGRVSAGDRVLISGHRDLADGRAIREVEAQ
jgi:RND family efflux transporter MFP subunit